MTDYMNPAERQRVWNIIIEAHSGSCPVCTGQVRGVEPDDCEFWPQLVNWHNQAAPLSILAPWTY